jgi:hypothetical protein
MVARTDLAGRCEAVLNQTAAGKSPMASAGVSISEGASISAPGLAMTVAF